VIPSSSPCPVVGSCHATRWCAGRRVVMWQCRMPVRTGRGRSFAAVRWHGDVDFFPSDQGRREWDIAPRLDGGWSISR